MKKICLTFDDVPLVSHCEFAIPLLKKHDLKATLFVYSSLRQMYMREEGILDHEREPDGRVSKIKEFNDDGFEIGNHSHMHGNMERILHASGEIPVVKDIEACNDFLTSLGVEKPTSFCYPGFHADLELANLLGRMGFSHARTGYIFDTHESQYNPQVKRPSPSYYSFTSPQDSLLIKSTGIFGELYGFKDFKSDVESMSENECGIFTFHGFACKEYKLEFEKIISYIVNNNIETVKLNELPT